MYEKNEIIVGKKNGINVNNATGGGDLHERVFMAHCFSRIV